MRGVNSDVINPGRGMVNKYVEPVRTRGQFTYLNVKIKPLKEVHKSSLLHISLSCRLFCSLLLLSTYLFLWT
jgi:hypothetical protein